MANPLKKTMVYLGLADEEFEVEESAAPAPAASPRPSAAPHAAPSASEGRATVTPLRKVQAARAPIANEMNEILTVHPKQYRDAQYIAESFREGVPVIINLSQMSDGDARRLIDFASGLSQGLYGKIERVTSKVFLLTPSHIAVTGEAGSVTGEVEASFAAQS